MQALLLVVIYLAFVSLGLPDSLLGAAWPSMYGPLSVPPHFAGIPAMTISACTIVSSAASGAVVRLLGTGRVTAISALLTALSLAAFTVSPRFGLLCACAVPLGLGAGAIDAALNNYVALHYKARHMNWLHCSWALGASAGPLALSFFLAGGGSWHHGYRAAAAAQGALALVLCLSLPLWKKDEGGARAMPSARAGKNEPFLAPLRLPRARRMCAAFFCYCALESTAGLWGGSYLTLERGLAPGEAARLVSLFYAGIMAGRFVSGFLSIRYSAAGLLIAGHALMAGGILLLIIPAGTLLLPPAFFTLGLGCAPVFPAMLHLTPRIFGAARSQNIIGLEMAGAYTGSALMPALFGRSAALTGFWTFPAAAALFLILEAACLLSLIRHLAAPLAPAGPSKMLDIADL